jgi:hypothetical protein
LALMMSGQSSHGGEPPFVSGSLPLGEQRFPGSRAGVDTGWNPLQGDAMSRVESPEDLRDAVVQRAGEAARRVSDVADDVGSRVAGPADRVALRTGARGVRTGTRAGAAGAKAGAKLGLKGSKLGLRGLLFGAKANARAKLRPARDAKLRLQLAHTSHELASKTSDLNEAVDSLNEVIRANRRAGGAGRGRLIAGVAVGSLITYHLDPAKGRERRASTMRQVQRLAKGG